MSELIDKSEVLQRLCAACSNMGSFACMGCVIPCIVKGVPTIEAEPVRHGRWIVRGQDIYCSECNEESLYNHFGASKFSHFCPNCGTRMNGGADNG